MVFSLSLGGVQVRIVPAADNDIAKNSNFSIQGVRHCNDGHIEADVSNFSGTIIISSEEVSITSSSSSSDVNHNETELHNSNIRELLQVVDGIPEPPPIVHEKLHRQSSSFLTANSHNTDVDPISSPYVPATTIPLSNQSSRVTAVDIDNEDDDVGSTLDMCTS